MKFTSALTIAALVGLGHAWTVTLYENQNFGGRHRDVSARSGECSNTNGFNDLTSSVKGDAHEGCNYFRNGSCDGFLFHTNANEDFKVLPGGGGTDNDKVSSVRCG